jgi:hypothetical protein
MFVVTLGLGYLFGLKMAWLGLVILGYLLISKNGVASF